MSIEKLFGFRAIGKRVGPLFAVAVACATWPASSRAAGDVEADLYANFIERTISEALSGELEARGISVTGVDLSRVDDTTLHFSVSVMAFGFNLPMALDANLSLTCDASGPSMWIGDVVASPLAPVSDEELAAETLSAQEAINTQVDAIVEPLWNELGKIKNDAIANQVCPHVIVQPDGAIHAELHFLNGCINGEYFHRECGANQTGNGIDHSCENGLKVLIEHDCTPKGADRR